MTERGAWRYHLAGWLVFVASAVCFTIGAIRAGDPLAIAGSVLFLLACFVFLVPVWMCRPRRD